MLKEHSCLPFDALHFDVESCLFIALKLRLLDRTTNNKKSRRGGTPGGVSRRRLTE